MNERELLVDCLRRLNRAEVRYYLTGLVRELHLAEGLGNLLSGRIKPKQTGISAKRAPWLTSG